MADEHYLTMDQLQVGLYVQLDLKWFEHPFAFSQFKIKSEDQIKTLLTLGLKQVRYSPELSDGKPPARQAASSGAPPAVAATSAAPELSPVMLAKRAMMEQMKLRRQAAERIEKAFVNTAHTLRDIEKNIYSRPAETVQQASKLISDITDSILSAPELAIHVMGDKMGGEELYFHSLNVTMLSMMMARDLKLPVEVVGALGLGALLHDIGRKEVPDKILRKTEPLTQAERNFYEMHCHFGVEIGQKLRLTAPVLAVIREHHELFDGTGYPAKLKAEAIGLLSRIVVIANYYDELCNPPLIADALTPHEALSLMFAKLRGKFDAKLLQVFIRCLGVYPPGTIVQLSNGVIGMVTTVNTSRPMKPMLVVYDADVPKDEAIMLDMERETEVNIAKAIRPAQVPREVYSYLSPRKRVSYYFDAAAPRADSAKP
jgi:putative nucleotidyltransferase with HDIG domain